MPMTFDGNGTITGLSAGGLPDSSIVTADIANAAITAAKLDGAQSGSAPIYGARAWVNFNGTGTVAIRASGNVSSITDNGTGDYTVNFTNALVDANFDANVTGDIGGASDFAVGCTRDSSTARTTSLVRVGMGTTGGLPADSTVVSVTIFR
jgi:hypothetical protein